MCTVIPLSELYCARSPFSYGRHKSRTHAVCQFRGADHWLTSDQSLCSKKKVYTYGRWLGPRKADMGLVHIGSKLHSRACQ